MKGQGWLYMLIHHMLEERKLTILRWIWIWNYCHCVFWSAFWVLSFWFWVLWIFGPAGIWVFSNWSTSTHIYRIYLKITLHKNNSRASEEFLISCHIPESGTIHWAACIMINYNAWICFFHTYPHVHTVCVPIQRTLLCKSKIYACDISIVVPKNVCICDKVT